MANTKQVFGLEFVCWAAKSHFCCFTFTKHFPI